MCFPICFSSWRERRYVKKNKKKFATSVRTISTPSLYDSADGLNNNDTRYATLRDLRPPSDSAGIRITTTPKNSKPYIAEYDEGGKQIFENGKVARIVGMYENRNRFRENISALGDDTSCSIREISFITSRDEMDSSRLSPNDAFSDVAIAEKPKSPPARMPYDRELSYRPCQREQQRMERWKKLMGMDFNETVNSLRRIDEV
ncbi:hypothetical protein L596_029220 [Steinernema carpocapsae]|uniref:Uncharacterized protein n=1 Tax=Steinernema carpocapsae TaxID=34508 RepID=A0A4U5LU06_STECR|nr:hypothetical protein L596_029220 [Steinernema carpocapsae]